MQWYPSPRPKCGCDADRTIESAVLEMRRGNPLRPRRAKMVWHYRERDRARFWHWSDQTVVTI